MAKMVFELSKEEFRAIVRRLQQGEKSGALEFNEIAGMLHELLFGIVNMGQLYIPYGYELRIDGTPIPLAIPLDDPESDKKLEKLVREQLDS